MTLTSALPAQAAPDLLSRRMPEDLGDGSSAGQNGSFPELLGQLAAHPDQRTSAPLAVTGEIGVQDPSQPPLPWKFRVVDALALSGGVEGVDAPAAKSDLQAAAYISDTVANIEASKSCRPMCLTLRSSSLPASRTARLMIPRMVRW
jgi:hypothetical protein